jgi:hypothetical protein
MTDTLEASAEVDTGLDAGAEDTGAQHADSPEIEALAAEIGWKPADQWKGEGHMPASDYLRHQAARAKDKSDEVKSLAKRMDKIARTSATVLERQLAEQREELEGRYADLVAANKPGEARRVAQQIDQLDRSSDDDDVAADFKTRNASWFEKDDEATAFAFGVCEREARKGTSPDKQLELAEAAVKKRFPELFEGTSSTALRRSAPVVGAPTSRSAPPRAKGITAETAPPEVTKALAGYLSRLDKTKHADFTKRYLDEYNKENGQ